MIKRKELLNRLETLEKECLRIEEIERRLNIVEFRVENEKGIRFRWDYSLITYPYFSQIIVEYTKGLEIKRKTIKTICLSYGSVYFDSHGPFLKIGDKENNNNEYYYFDIDNELLIKVTKKEYDKQQILETIEKGE